MVTTSDIGVSVAIDNDKHIDEIVGVLRKYATITVEKNMVIVCVVGDLEWQNVGFEARIINALKGKSYITTALGYRVCQKGLKVLYANTSRLLGQLKATKVKGSIL